MLGHSLGLKPQFRNGFHQQRTHTATSGRGASGPQETTSANCQLQTRPETEQRAEPNNSNAVPGNHQTGVCRHDSGTLLNRIPGRTFGRRSQRQPWWYCLKTLTSSRVSLQLGRRLAASAAATDHGMEKHQRRHQHLVLGPVTSASLATHSPGQHLQCIDDSGSEHLPHPDFRYYQVTVSPHITTSLA